jgi:hypothetical protein
VLCVPLVASAPFHAPPAVHEVALVDVQVNVTALPALIVIAEALSDTTGAATVFGPPPPQLDANRTDPASTSRKLDRTNIP